MTLPRIKPFVTPGWRELREGLGVTQAELADLAGIPYRSFQRYEADPARATGADLERVFAALVELRKTQDGRHRARRRAS